VKPNLGADGRPTGMVGNQKIVRYDDLPSTQMMRAMTNRPTDFRGAAQRNSGMWNDPMINRLEQIQQKAQAAREQREKNRKVEQGVAEQGIARAYGMAIDAWRNAELRHGLEADKKTETANRYRVGAVEPQTLRELNAMIAPIVGMRNGEKIVGIYAASSVDANGTDRGQPTVFVRWRRPDGTIKQEPISYREAAQYVRKTMGNPGDRETDRNFVLQYGNTWRNAAGDGDELGLSKTADYLEWKQKQDATANAAEEARKLNAAKVALTEAQTKAVDSAEGRAQKEFDQKQKDLANAEENKAVTDAAAMAKNYLDRADKVQKDTPEAADAYRKLAAYYNTLAESERGKLAAKKTAAERKSEAANSKPGDSVSFEPLALWDDTKNMVPVVGAEEFTDPKTGKKGFRVMKGVATGAAGKPKYDDNGKLVLEQGWVLGEDGIPVLTKNSSAPNAGQSPDGNAGQRNAQQQASTPEQQYAADYNARVTDFKKAGGTYSESDSGKASLEIEGYDLLPSDVKAKVERSPRRLTPEVVEAQKTASRIIDRIRDTIKEEARAEYDRLRNEVATRNRTSGMSPAERDAYVDRRIKKWIMNHRLMKGINAHNRLAVFRGMDGMISL
jgi:hypothetical protein